MDVTIRITEELLMLEYERDLLDVSRQLQAMDGFLHSKDGGLNPSSSSVDAEGA
jgi:hypothetical protein